MSLHNLARMTTGTTGTGTITLASTVAGYISFSGAGVVDGETITYGISDGNNSEVGHGVYTASGSTLTRTVLNSTNGNALLNLSGNAQVFLTVSAADILNPANNLSDVASASTARTNLGVAPAQVETSVSSALPLSATTTNIAYTATATLTATIALSTTLTTKWTNMIFALGGPVTIAVNSADKINGGSAGVGTVIPKGYFATITTDANGNFYIEMGPALLGVNSIASASTVDLGTLASSSATVTGTTAITSFGSSAGQAGQIFTLTFASAGLVLTYNATSMLLPTHANITTQAGDVAQFQYLGSGNWQCIDYQRADGTALSSAGSGVTLGQVYGAALIF